MRRFDTIVLGGQVVLPGRDAVRCDLGISNGKIAAIVDELKPGDGEEVIDATGLVVFPGCVDCHTHLGIYRPVDVDARSETASALVGGVTTVLSYFRTGQHYLNKTGPYREIIPEVLGATQGNSYTDYGYHIAPMTTGQVKEIEWMAGEMGIATFKFFMFYKGLNLSASSTDGKALTMSESYDLGHLHAIMAEVAKADSHYGSTGRISISVHCEDDELIRHFIRMVNLAGLNGLRAYHEARPPLSERVAIQKATTLAVSTGVRLNLLHLSSAEALEAGCAARDRNPAADIKLEVTLHHLGLSYDMLEGKGLGGKVNPPIRTRRDTEALWDGVVNGKIDWVASDHACTMSELKGDELWQAACGFGGTALMYPFMVSEGYHKRGLSLGRIAELLSTNPARAHGCYPQKGSISVGADADLAIIDLGLKRTVTTNILLSAQDHTPFAGFVLKGWPVRTVLRGRTVYRNGEIAGEPEGRYLKRPVRRYLGQF
ncbi:MAG: dihydroorotase [Ignavibacteriales bacterium]